MVYEKELPDSSNYASPMVAGNKLYLFTSDATYVVQAGKEFKLLNKCSLNEVFTAAPACAPGRLLIRTPQSLYCIGKAAAK